MTVHLQLSLERNVSVKSWQIIYVQIFIMIPYMVIHQFAWKIWLHKVGFSLIQILGILYIRSLTICVSTISITDDDTVI